MMAVHKDVDGARRAADNLEGEMKKLQAALSAFQTPADDPPEEISLPRLPRNRRAADEARPPESTARCSERGKEQNSSEPVDNLPEAGWGWLGRILSLLGFIKFRLGTYRRGKRSARRLP